MYTHVNKCKNDKIKFKKALYPTNSKQNMLSEQVPRRLGFQKISSLACQDFDTRQRRKAPGRL
jgi:hypothetical protein